MVVGEDGTIHIAFTFWRQTIKYVQIGEDFFAA
jgi:predicted neuraminidase